MPRTPTLVALASVLVSALALPSIARADEPDAEVEAIYTDVGYRDLAVVGEPVPGIAVLGLVEDERERFGWKRAADKLVEVHQVEGRCHRERRAFREFAGVRVRQRLIRRLVVVDAGVSSGDQVGERLRLGIAIGHHLRYSRALEHAQ